MTEIIPRIHAGSAHHAGSHKAANHSDQLATGAELTELTDSSETTLHSHVASGAVTREGGDTTEHTTTSTSAVDLSSITSLNIGALVPLHVSLRSRKTSGAADDADIGLKINSTSVFTPATNVGLLHYTTNNQAEELAVDFGIGARLTNYTFPISSYRLRPRISSSGAAASGTDDGPLGTYTNTFPLVAITSFILEGIVGNGSITLAVDEWHLYSRAVS